MSARAPPARHPEFALAFKLLALTGWRRSELLAHALKDRRPDGGGGLRWADIDLAARVALLRDAKSGDRYTPLAAPVVALLAAARPTDAAPDAPVCSGRRPGLPLANPEKPWAALLARAELQPRGLHSLRRTVGSVAGDLGLGEYLIGALLGHSRAGVTGRYVIPAQDPVREVAERVAAIIAEALQLDSRDLVKVLPMTSREGVRHSTLRHQYKLQQNGGTAQGSEIEGSTYDCAGESDCSRSMRLSFLRELLS